MRAASRETTPPRGARETREAARAHGAAATALLIEARAASPEEAARLMSAAERHFAVALLGVRQVRCLVGAERRPELEDVATAARLVN